MNPGFSSGGFPPGIPPAGFMMMPSVPGGDGSGRSIQVSVAGHPMMMMMPGGMTQAQGYARQPSYSMGSTTHQQQNIGGGISAGQRFGQAMIGQHVPANQQYMTTPTSSMSTPINVPFIAPGGMTQYGMYVPQTGMPYFMPGGQPPGGFGASQPPPYPTQMGMNYHQAAPVTGMVDSGAGSGGREELTEEERKRAAAEMKRRQFDEQKRRLSEFSAMGGKTMNADALIESIIGSKADKPMNVRRVNTPGLPAAAAAAAPAASFVSAPAASAAVAVAPDDDDDFGDFLSVTASAGSGRNTEPFNQSISTDNASANQVRTAETAAVSSAAAAAAVSPEQHSKNDLLAMMNACSDLSVDKNARGFARKPTAVNQISVSHQQPITYTESRQALHWSTIGVSDQLSQLFTLPVDAAVPVPDTRAATVESPPATQLAHTPGPPQVTTNQPSGSGSGAVEPPPARVSQPSENQPTRVALPRWATGEMPVPELYKSVLRATQRGNMIETGLIYPILVGSGVPRETLGHLWDLCCTQQRGCLVEQELYLMLAMISVVQNNMDYRTLDILARCPQAPIPNLGNFSISPQASSAFTSGISTNIHQSATNNQNPPTTDSRHSSVSTESGGGGFSSSTGAGHRNEDDFDDFADFQSASAGGQSGVLKHATNPGVRSSMTTSQGVWGAAPLGGDLMAGDIPSKDDDKYSVFRGEASTSVFSKRVSSDTMGLDSEKDGKASSGDLFDMPQPDVVPYSTSDGHVGSFHPLATTPTVKPTELLPPGDKYAHMKSLVSSAVYTQPSQSTSAAVSPTATAAPAAAAASAEDDWADFQAGTSSSSSYMATASQPSGMSSSELKFDPTSPNYSVTSGANIDWRANSSNNSNGDHTTGGGEAGSVFEMDKDELDWSRSEPLSQQQINDPKFSSATIKEEQNKNVTFTSGPSKSVNDPLSGFFRGNESHKNPPVGLGISPLDFHPPELPDDDDFDDFAGYHSNTGFSTAASGVTRDLGGMSTLTGLDDDFDGFVGIGGTSQSKLSTSEMTPGSSMLVTSHSGLTLNSSQASLEFSGWDSRAHGGSAVQRVDNQDDIRSTASLDLQGGGGGTWHQEDSPNDSTSLSSGDLPADVAHPPPGVGGRGGGLVVGRGLGDGTSIASLELRADIMVGETGSMGRNSLGGGMEEVKEDGGVVVQSREGAGVISDCEVMTQWSVGRPLDAKDILDTAGGFGALSDRYSGFMGSSFQEGDRHAMEWTRCMEKGCEVLKQAEQVLCGANSLDVIIEILNTQHGLTYVEGVYEIYCVLRRISEEMVAVSVSTARLQELSTEAESLWKKIFSQLSANHSLAEVVPRFTELRFDRSALLKADDDGVRDKACGICLLNVDWSPSSQSQSGVDSKRSRFCNAAKLTYGGRTYHASCANFWLNRVDLTLPCLTIPELL